MLFCRGHGNSSAPPQVVPVNPFGSSNPGSMGECIPLGSQGGVPMMGLNGYVYDLDYYSGDGSQFFWRCHERQRCNAAAVTTGDLRRPVLLWDGTGRHLHAPDRARVGALSFACNLRARARRQPFENALSLLGEAVGALADPRVLQRVLPHLPAMAAAIAAEQTRARRKMALAAKKGSAALNGGSLPSEDVLAAAALNTPENYDPEDFAAAASSAIPGGAAAPSLTTPDAFDPAPTAPEGREFF